MSPPAGYEVLIKPSAEKEMDRLPASVFRRAARVILALEADPRPVGCKKLHGVEEYSLRVGAYRILYTIDDSARQIEVVAVGHRRDIYRRL